MVQKAAYSCESKLAEKSFQDLGRRSVSAENVCVCVCVCVWLSEEREIVYVRVWEREKNELAEVETECWERVYMRETENERDIQTDTR